MSAKITIRELDGTEYQLKRRIAAMIHAAGFSRRVQRGLHEMIRVTLSHALLSVMKADDSGQLLAEGPPSSLNLSYPAKDQRTCPRPFGYYQDWSCFPVHV